MQQAQFKAAWIEALRSGRFMQTHNVLFGDALYDHTGEEVPMDDDECPIDPQPGHCCLGVALELTGGDPDNHSSEELPSNEWAAKWGIQYSDMETLAGYNDGGCSFDYIADVLEFAEFTPYELDTDEGDED